MKELTYFEQVERTKRDYENAREALIDALREFYIQEEIMYRFSMSGMVHEREKVIARLTNPEKFAETLFDDPEKRRRAIAYNTECVDYAKERMAGHIKEILSDEDTYDLSDM